jgi:[ribosomal protein S5]-alanine N-acetyltransferase
MGPRSFASERFDMRPWDRDDVAAVHPILGDPRVVWWDEKAGSLDHTREVLERVVRESEREPEGRGWFAVVDRVSGMAVANAVLRGPAIEAEGLELGWHVRHDRWGQGIAPEAARAAIEHARERFGITTFVALILPSNEPSLRVAAKLGMHHERDVIHAELLHGLYRLGDRAGLVYGPPISGRATPHEAA